MIYYIFLLFYVIINVNCASNYSFTSDFLFGTATAAYQIEGAWNESGKGENIWDILTHEFSDLILDGSNGDIACDSYNKYEEDVNLLVDMGIDVYRFSVSWSRIYPEGHPYNPNAEGIAYYNNLIDALVAKNITPMLTIYHWDLPQPLQLLGGWTNPHVVEWFAAYATTLFTNYADRVKYWITINEPYQVCQEGYDNILKAPAVNMPGIGGYLCTHNLLKAHAEAYHIFDNLFRSKNDGLISISINALWFEPNTTNDEDAAERARQFNFGLYGNPIFSTTGDYPQVVKDYVGNRSAIEGFSESRLQTFTSDEIDYIKGTYDFFGLNHYTTYMTTSATADDSDISFENDRQVTIWFDSSWPMDGANRVAIVPSGFRKLLTWIKDTYNNPDIYITENGCADYENLTDDIRVSFYGMYLEALLDAINADEVSVKLYTAWSLMDNFEWRYGYQYRYGLHHTNFSDPDRTRTAKTSATFFKNVVSTKVVGAYNEL